MRKLLRWCCATIVASGLWSSGAFGQVTDDTYPYPTVPETTVTGQPQAAAANAAPGGSGGQGQPTVITPTQTATPLSNTTSSITVITREQIERTQQPYVLNVLRQVPGLDVVQSGPNGGFTSVFLRGANSNQTKVLLDGVPLNDPSNAGRSFDFSTLSTDNIEQIEVLRGPQSMVYGSDAIGGVVNIITRRGSGPPTIRASTSAGSFGTTQQRALLSGGTDLYHYSVGGMFFNSAGFSSAAEWLGNTEHDAFRNGTLSGRFGFTPTQDLEFEYIVRYIDARAEVDDFSFVTGLPFDNGIRANLSNQYIHRVQARALLLDGFAETVAGYSLTDYDRFDTDSGPFLDPEFLGQTRKVDLRTNFYLTEGNIFTVGTDYFEEDASSTSVAQQAQNDSGIWLQDQLELADRWFATAGYRFDNHSAAGYAETYRFATRYTVYETGTSFRGSIGTGFRAPALAENFFPFGNQNLKPETSKGWDYGLEQSLLDGRVLLGATYFRNDFSNLIIFDPNTFILDNIGSALATGVETTALWQVDPCTQVSVAYTHTDTRDRDTGLQLLRRPRDKVSLTLTRTLWCERARANLYLYYVGDRRDSRATLDAYTVVNVSGTYDWNDHVQFFGRIDNLFDERYEEVQGFGVPSASAYGGVSMVW